MLYERNRKKRQLDKKLFEHPTAEYRGTPFWAWNCDLKKDELLRQIDGRINRLVTQIRPVCSYQYLNASHADLLIESNTFVLKRLVTHQIIVPASSSRLTCIPALS